MSDDISDIQYRCDLIREMNENKRELLFEYGFLESMSSITLEAIRDHEYKIEQIIISHSGRNKNIEKIKSLMNDPEIKIKVEKIMREIGAKRVEELSAFSDTVLRICLDVEGEK